MRGLYMSPHELRVHAESAEQARRIQAEAAALNETTESDAARDDVDNAGDRGDAQQLLPGERIARVASSVKTLNELLKGEQFVQQEVRRIARERNAWLLAAALASAAAVLAAALFHARRGTRRK